MLTTQSNSLEKKVLKVDVKATAEYSVSSDAAGIAEIAVKVRLTIGHGRITLPDEVIKYTRDESQGKIYPESSRVETSNGKFMLTSREVFNLAL